MESESGQEGKKVKANADRLLIVGCGNPMAGDDGAGFEVVRRLSETGDCGCDLRAAITAGVELLDLFSRAEVILLVDAVVSSGGAPGTLHLTPLPSKAIEARALSSISSHGWGLAESLELARSLGRAIPRLFLLGIEVGVVTAGAPRSPAVEQAIALVLERIPQLKSLLLANNSFPMIGTRTFSPDDRSFPGN
jgi:hydrogenase maturation protease